MALVGEVGTGKTTLLHAVLRHIEKELELRVAFISHTDMSFDEILFMALLDLKLAKPSEPLRKMDVIRRLHNFAERQLSRGGNVVFLVDEAQNLGPSAMENLRLLSNLETYKNKLIQIVLAGQPELDVKLSQPQLRQLNQRISLKRYITPLSEKETDQYVQHRLGVAGYNGPALFDEQAQQLIWEYSGGVPRKINVLCDNAFLIGYALQQKIIGESVIQEAIRDLTWSPFSGTNEAPAITAETPVSTPVAISPPLQQKTSEVPQKVSPVQFAIGVSAVLAAGLMFLLGVLLGSSRSVPDESPKSSKRRAQIVVVREGDNLTRIINRAYGKFDSAVLNSILHENSEIRDPNLLKVGQVIKLPLENLEK
jgi:type II secretory pathway predicted ATPase ExeA